MSPKSLLQQLTATPLEKPCDSPWEQMRGDAKVRRCEQCAREVFSISEMTALEAEVRLLNASDETPCIRYARDAAGSVVHLTPLRSVSPHRPSPARALLMASAVGVALLPSRSQAQGEPPAVSTSSATSSTTSPAASSTVDAGPEARPATPPTPPTPPPPHYEMVTGGVPPMPQERAPIGKLTVTSRAKRSFIIAGVPLETPLTGYNLPPGKIVLEVEDAHGKTHPVTATIKRDKTTTVDLDDR